MGGPLSSRPPLLKMCSRIRECFCCENREILAPTAQAQLAEFEESGGCICQKDFVNQATYYKLHKQWYGKWHRYVSQSPVGSVSNSSRESSLRSIPQSPAAPDPNNPM